MIFAQEFAILASSTLIASLSANCSRLDASGCFFSTVSLPTPYHVSSPQVFEPAPRKCVTCDSRISRRIWRLWAQRLLTLVYTNTARSQLVYLYRSVSVEKLRISSNLGVWTNIGNFHAGEEFAGMGLLWEFPWYIRWLFLTVITA